MISAAHVRCAQTISLHAIEYSDSSMRRDILASSSARPWFVLSSIQYSYYRSRPGSTFEFSSTRAASPLCACSSELPQARRRPIGTVRFVVKSSGAFLALFATAGR